MKPLLKIQQKLEVVTVRHNQKVWLERYLIRLKKCLDLKVRVFLLAPGQAENIMQPTMKIGIVILQMQARHLRGKQVRLAAAN